VPQDFVSAIAFLRVSNLLRISIFEFRIFYSASDFGIRVSYFSRTPQCLERGVEGQKSKRVQILEKDGGRAGAVLGTWKPPAVKLVM
jgi:hypothetical protein